MAHHLSVNYNTLRLVRDLCDRADEYGVIVKEKDNLGTKIIDAGIAAKGGFLAGKIITEICLGGLGEAEITYKDYEAFEIPSILVLTDHPAIATLGSQFAGWHIKINDYSAIGSGPARALALKPKSIYREIEYEDEADTAILILETLKEPPEEVITYISECCKVESSKVFIILVPTSTVTGFIQVSGRVVETGIHRLTRIGLDPKVITHACGYAPIMPIHPDYVEAMGRTNDAILYGGVTHYVVSHGEDEKLRNLVGMAVSSASKEYGRPFAEIFEEVNLDFYRIDPDLFAPAVLSITNAETGKTFSAGRINPEILRRSIFFKDT